MKFSKTAKLLNAKKDAPEKYRTNIYVTEHIYKAFQRTCQERGVTVTQALDSMMEDFVREFAPVVSLSQAPRLIGDEE